METMEDIGSPSSSSRVTDGVSSAPSNVNNNNKEDDIDIEELLARPRHRRGLFRRQKASLNKARSLLDAPEFVKRLSAFEEAKAGSTVVFSCQWQAFPKPSVKWYRDDEEITDENNRLQFNESDSGEMKLVINNCRKTDEAAYKCKAENAEGVASTTGYLSVTGDVKEKPLSAQPRKNAQHAVSNPPRLRAIVEQKSLELREEEECNALPPSPIHDYVETFQKKHKTTAKQKSPPLPLDDLKKGYEDDSGSDTSVDSQDFDRVPTTDPESDRVFDRELTPEADSTPRVGDENGDRPQPSRVTGHSEDRRGSADNPQSTRQRAARKGNGIAVTAIADVKFVSSFNFAKVESSPVLHGPISNALQAQASPDKATQVHSAPEFPWLFALAFSSFGTLVATATEMSPILFVFLLALISLLSFRILLSTKTQCT